MSFWAHHFGWPPGAYLDMTIDEGTLWLAERQQYVEAIQAARARAT